MQTYIHVCMYAFTHHVCVNRAVEPYDGQNGRHKQFCRSNGSDAGKGGGHQGRKVSAHSAPLHSARYLPGAKMVKGLGTGTAEVARSTGVHMFLTFFRLLVGLGV